MLYNTKSERSGPPSILRILPAIASFVVLSTQITFPVSVAPGTIRGAQCPGLDVTQYLGIPFAEPPTGERRFASPSPFERIYDGGILDATRFAPACIQFGTPSTNQLGPQSEDCLYLNVWVPASATAKSNLPVKIWIYGGGFETGGTSNALYDGCYFATDAVVVSLAYRLGPLGFLGVQQAGIAGNMGLQDVMLGVKWVHDNVAAFGGDPRKILVFGESAGAGLAWLLSTMNDAPSLMNAAVGESGVGVILPTKAQNEALGQAYSETLGCETLDISCFRAKSIEELTIANPPTPALALGMWFPFVDGKVLPQQPALTPSKVPLLAGTSETPVSPTKPDTNNSLDSMEGTFFVIGAVGSPSNITAANYLTLLPQELQRYTLQLKQLYPLEAYNATGFAPFYALSQIFTDYNFKCPTRRALNTTRTANVAAYTYFNKHKPSCGWEQNVTPNSQIVDILGATHGSEIQYVFRHLTGLPVPNGTCSTNTAERHISDVLSDAWTSIAATGVPGDIGNGSLWPLFDVATSQGLVVDDSAKVGMIDYSLCDLLWDKVAVVQLANATAGMSPT